MHPCMHELLAWAWLSTAAGNLNAAEVQFCDLTLGLGYVGLGLLIAELLQWEPACLGLVIPSSSNTVAGQRRPAMEGGQLAPDTAAVYQCTLLVKTLGSLSPVFSWGRLAMVVQL